MLKKEWTTIDNSIVEEVIQKWKGHPVSIWIDQCYIYKMFSKVNGWRTIFALNVLSEDVFAAREDLKLARKPPNYIMHTSLLEKEFVYIN